MLSRFIDFKKTFKAILVLAVLAFIVPSAGLSATVTPASDTITSHKTNASANHTIRFKSPSGIDSPTDNITINLSSFVFGAVNVNDMDMFHGPTGFENTDNLAGAAGINTWGVSIAGGVVTFNPPTNSAPGTIAPNSIINIYIGTHAAGGANQLNNPALAGQYQIYISGGFGDSGQMAALITDNDNVGVTATVPSGLAITGISPNAAYTGNPGFTISIYGTGFMNDSVVRLDGADRSTTFVSSTLLTAQILGSDLTSPANLSVNVWNPSPGQLSNSATLSVTTQSGGGGSEPPVNLTISLIKVINIQPYSVRITWSTNLQADSLIDFGLTDAYGQSVSNDSLIYSHGLDLTSLTPDTVYHFRITSKDQNGNSATSQDLTFTTAALQALTISNVRAVSITDKSAVIMWDSNIPASSSINYGPSKSLGLPASVPGDVTSHVINLTGLNPNTTYFYKVTSSDSTGQTVTSASYSFRTLGDLTPPTNPTLTATAGDQVVLLQWTLPNEPDLAGVKLIRTTGSYPTGPDDGVLVYDGLGNSMLDTGLTNGTTYYYALYAYDINGNFSSGALDNATPFGTIDQPATSTPPVIPPTEPPTTPPTSTPPTEPVTPPTTPTEPTIPPPTTGLTDILLNALYYTANGSILLQPNPSGYYGVLPGSSVYVYVPTANLGSTPQLGVMTVAGGAYSLVLNGDGTAYTGTFLAPPTGIFNSDIRVTFENGQIGTAQDDFQIQPAGQVVEETLVSGPGPTIPDANVTLYELRNGDWIKWNGNLYGQTNTLKTDGEGRFAFVVPNGTYRAEVTKEGYEPLISSTIKVTSNVFGSQLSLIKQPEAAPATSTLPIIENITEQVRFVALIAKSRVNQPEVKQAVENYAAPTLLTVAILNTTAALPLFNLLSYLQFLFTQPILLFGRRKKKRWGVVYNSLTKQPVEFVVVRLVHYESRLIVQTRVTDKHGRYVFYPKPGNYILEVSKPGFIFPTQYLMDEHEDGEYVDLYHGEMIALSESAPIAFNIPIDPITAQDTPRRVIYGQILRHLQHSIALIGVLLALIALVISPTWLMAIVFLGQLAFYLLFRRLALPSKAKPWGLIFDKATGKPIRNAVVRIFDKKFDKLLETMVSDDKGRYGFFADKNIFYITVEKPGYAKLKTGDIDLLKTKKETVIDYNLGLKRN